MVLQVFVGKVWGRFLFSNGLHALSGAQWRYMHCIEVSRD